MDVGPPPTLRRLHPRYKHLPKGAQTQEEVLRLPKHRRLSADPAAPVDQLLRVPELPAPLALVAPGRRVLAGRARPLDVAVGKEAPVRLAVRLLPRLRADVPPVVQRREDVVHHSPVVVRPRAGVAVPGNAEFLPHLQVLGVVPRGQLLRRHPLLLGPDGDGRSVLIAAGHHYHLVALEPVVSGEDVRGQVRPRDLANVRRAVHVRPCYADEDPLSHPVDASNRG